MVTLTEANDLRQIASEEKFITEDDRAIEDIQAEEEQFKQAVLAGSFRFDADSALQSGEMSIEEVAKWADMQEATLAAKQAEEDAGFVEAVKSGNFSFDVESAVQSGEFTREEANRLKQLEQQTLGTLRVSDELSGAFNFDSLESLDKDKLDEIGNYIRNIEEINELDTYSELFSAEKRAAVQKTVAEQLQNAGINVVLSENGLPKRDDDGNYYILDENNQEQAVESDMLKDIGKDKFGIVGGIGGALAGGALGSAGGPLGAAIGATVGAATGAGIGGSLDLFNAAVEAQEDLDAMDYVARFGREAAEDAVLGTLTAGAGRGLKYSARQMQKLSRAWKNRRVTKYEDFLDEVMSITQTPKEEADRLIKSFERYEETMRATNETLEAKKSSEIVQNAGNNVAELKDEAINNLRLMNTLGTKNWEGAKAALSDVKSAVFGKELANLPADTSAERISELKKQIKLVATSGTETEKLAREMGKFDGEGKKELASSIVERGRDVHKAAQNLPLVAEIENVTGKTVGDATDEDISNAILNRLKTARRDADGYLGSVVNEVNARLTKSGYTPTEKVFDKNKLLERLADRGKSDIAAELSNYYNQVSTKGWFQNFNDLHEYGKYLNSLSASLSKRSPAFAQDKALLDSLKRDVSNEMNRAITKVKGVGNTLSKNYSKAMANYSTMRAAEDAALGKSIFNYAEGIKNTSARDLLKSTEGALKSPTKDQIMHASIAGFDTTDLSRRLISGENDADVVFKALPPKFRTAVENKVISDIVERATNPSNLDDPKSIIRVADWSQMANDLGKLKLDPKNTQGRAMVEQVQQISDIMKSEENLFRAVHGLKGDTALTDANIATSFTGKLMQATVGALWRRSKLTAHQLFKPRNLDVVANKLDKLMRNPLKTSSVKDFLKEIPEVERPAMENYIKQFQSEIAKQDAKSGGVRATREAINDMFGERVDGPLGVGYYVRANSKVNPESIKGLAFKDIDTVGPLAGGQDFSKLTMLQKKKALNSNPQFIENIKEAGFNGIRLGDIYMMF